MPQLRQSVDLPVSAEAAFLWYGRPGAFERLCPPWVKIDVQRTPAALADGERMEMTLHRGPFSILWKSRYQECVPGRQFCDVQEEGPFRRWKHCRRFTARQEGCRQEDEIDYESLGLAGELLADRDLKRLFTFRNRQLVSDLRRHQETGLRPLRVAISGESGLVGRAFSRFMSTGGHRIHPLVRGRPKPGTGEIRWDPTGPETDREALEGIDAVVHLAGESIAGLWTAEKRQRLYDSRVQGTRRLCEALAQLRRKPAVLIAASAVGYYGNRGDEVLEEGSGPGTGFLAGICRDWEAATKPAEEAGIRVVHLRVSIVISARGGLFTALRPLFAAGLGGPVGGGRQYISWISSDDISGLIQWLIAHEEIAGAVNACSPDPVTNRRFGEIYGSVLRRPALLPAPAFAVKGVLGRQMAEELVLSSTRAVPGRALSAGFEFRHPELESAMREELGAFSEDQLVSFERS